MTLHTFIMQGAPSSFQEFFDDSVANHLDTPDQPAFQPDLDPVRMRLGVGQNLFDYPFGAFAGTLIFFQDNENPQTSFYIIPIHAILASLSYNIMTLASPRFVRKFSQGDATGHHAVTS